uniref:UDP-N-acetylglucosamine transferase subunit ALG14 n=1 Tax=Cyanistes caeruleus TaxID=156563 RepID=A0A8C0UC22_CYACU
SNDKKRKLTQLPKSTVCTPSPFLWFSASLAPGHSDPAIRRLRSPVEGQCSEQWLEQDCLFCQHPVAASVPGGHTTEILRLLSCLSESYSPRHYVLADSDKMSEAKIRSFEQKRAETFSESQQCCWDKRLWDSVPMIFRINPFNVRQLLLR